MNILFQLLNANNDPVFLFSVVPSGLERFVYVNEAALCRYGYNLQEFQAIGLKDVSADPDMPTIVERNTSKKFKAPTRSIFQTRHFGKCGTLFPVKICSSIVEWNQQDYYLLTIKDQSEMLRWREKFRTVFQSSLDAIFLARIDDGVFIHEVNEAFSRCLGYLPKEIVGKSVYDLHLWENDEDCKKFAARLGETGFVENLKIKFYTKDRAVGIGLISAHIFDLQGQKMIFCVLRDMTTQKCEEGERRQLETQMREVQKMKSFGFMSGGVAHDFKNLVTVILGRAELTKKLVPDDSEAYQDLGQIEIAAERAADLAEQMLTYSGKGKAVVETIDLNPLTEEILSMLKGTISKNIVLDFTPCRTLRCINVDATQIRQIVMNLILNASEAIGTHHGYISIKTDSIECTQDSFKDSWLDSNLPAGLYISFEVTDNGCGMDDETLAKLFVPFFTTKRTGHGLGMSAVLGIVRGHRGAITVRSTKGEGTTFKILFPVSVDWSDADSDRLQSINGESWTGGT
jgi:PAS domain S-box-containing protein